MTKDNYIVEDNIMSLISLGNHTSFKVNHKTWSTDYIFKMDKHLLN